MRASSAVTSSSLNEKTGSRGPGCDWVATQSMRTPSIREVPAIRCTVRTYVRRLTIFRSLDASPASPCRLVTPRTTPGSPADAALATLGIDRYCAVRSESFRALESLVVGRTCLRLPRAAADLEDPDRMLSIEIEADRSALG